MCNDCKQLRKEQRRQTYKQARPIYGELDDLQPKQKGNYIELSVMMEALRKNIKVSMPYGDNSTYDQIWDVDGKLFKVQIKYAQKLSNGSYKLNTTHAVYVGNKLRQIPYSKCEIPPANNQGANINWLSDYELQIWLNNHSESERISE